MQVIKKSAPPEEHFYIAGSDGSKFAISKLSVVNGLPVTTLEKSEGSANSICLSSDKSVLVAGMLKRSDLTDIEIYVDRYDSDLSKSKWGKSFQTLFSFDSSKYKG